MTGFVVQGHIKQKYTKLKINKKYIYAHFNIVLLHCNGLFVLVQALK